MKLRSVRFSKLAWAIVLLLCFFAWRGIQPAGVARAQQQQASPAPAAAPTADPQQPAAAPPAQQAPVQAPGGPVLKTESRLVRVDVVVTDKKGNYVSDLTAKDFKVLDDNKEQTVTNFSFGTDPNAPPGAQKHYMVLFFDDSTMDGADQIRAREAAAKFIDGNAGPDRVMAVVDFGGTLRIVQNFTADVEHLKKAVAGVKGSFVSPNGEQASGMQTDTFSAVGASALSNTGSGFRSPQRAAGDSQPGEKSCGGSRTQKLDSADDGISSDDGIGSGIAGDDRCLQQSERRRVSAGCSRASCAGLDEPAVIRWPAPWK